LVRRKEKTEGKTKVKAKESRTTKGRGKWGKESRELVRRVVTRPFTKSGRETGGGGSQSIPGTREHSPPFQNCPEGSRQENVTGGGEKGRQNLCHSKGWKQQRRRVVEDRGSSRSLY